ncbi:kunitz-type serine protease inhibitor 6-like isoform X2 [Homarus americanus]|uniref:kunitz-type serine protease inhibitor 6-like isoform X2 n=1 Tax=Homarus americanus TaxID=6706 RepID=UPI001C46E146|nr:kunitz-type serine protease inhibitor 6-like isoform X2 [Homarus americanus]
MGEMETKRYILFTLATMVVVVNGYKVTKLFPNVCYDSPDPGPCRAFIPSYFYNPKTNICDCFVYGGCQGNDNRFPDLEQCLETCGDESYQEVITDKCVSLFNVVNPQEEEDVLDQYGSQTHQVPNLCFDPPVTGLCRAHFPHFYFNSETQTCDCFVYGGCGGNNNKFSTLEECLTTCGGQPSQQHNTESCDKILGSQNPLVNREPLVNVTLLPETQQTIQETQEPQQLTQETQEPQQLTQETQEPQQTIQETQEPQQLTQETQEPQQLTQETQEPQQLTQETQEPQQTIQETQQMSEPHQESQQMTEPQQKTHQVPNLCFDPPVTGLCRAYFPHFYFNSETQTCDCFVYGGCGGNDNKFSTLEECLTTCGGQPSQQHNTESCYRILGSQNPLADITLLSQRETQQPQQPTEEETQQSAVATQTLGRENKEEESTGSHGVTSQKFGSSVIRAGSIYVGKPVSIPGFLP